MPVYKILISIDELFHYYMYVESYKTMILDTIHLCHYYVYVHTIKYSLYPFLIFCRHWVAKISHSFYSNLSVAGSHTNKRLCRQVSNLSEFPLQTNCCRLFFFRAMAELFVKFGVTATV